MKILFVSSSILPYPGGSSEIMENLSQNFSNNEMVVLGSRSLRLSKLERPDGSPLFKYFFSEISLFGRGARFFNWFRRFRLNALIRFIESAISENEITHVIGVYPNAYYCIAAARAARKKQLPFYSYFHNTYIENSAIIDKNAEVWQNEIFRSSNYIFVMSKGMEMFYSKKYGLDKFIPLVHTFNILPDQEEIETTTEKKDKYKLVAFGNFNESNLDATKRFLKAIRNYKQFNLSIYTHVPKLLLQRRGLDLTAFDYKGSVPPDEIYKVLQGYDLCILTHGFKGGYGEIEYQTIFPTRTIQMLISGKPIIAHSPKNSFLNEFIKSTNCAYLVEEESSEMIIKALSRVRSDELLQKNLTINARKAALQFYGPTVAQKLKNLLNETAV